ncbi:N-acetylmuramoyl-L-alanine amidase [Candidatus Pantoea persica]|uniref:N-acetylmuramoyl-L-alanine amidase n=1 Tax=Candidatus Pantoea persica TaxID=2518128 RepID=UPI00215D9E29|nr:N-acetylmuramoyl-L-alanine amidase [Candidatus Pantoea persica]MBA2817108.1 N-acetylmuramoyl-L-alanine amidase AmiA precursor [Candidatus Pantoea persica]
MDPRQALPDPPQNSGKRIVMIDPGHGGIDSGAVGGEGSEEKHVVLAHPRIEVRLTRDSDHVIPLSTSASKSRISTAPACLCRSTLCRSTPTALPAPANGASVFALSNCGASSAMACYLSDKENAADKIGGAQVEQQDNYLYQILFDLVQTDTIRNSLTLGKHVLDQIRPVHHLHSEHTEQTAFAVLKSPSILSVLVETSFYQPARRAAARHHRVPAKNRRGDR